MRKGPAIGWRVIEVRGLPAFAGRQAEGYNQKYNVCHPKRSPWLKHHAGREGWQVSVGHSSSEFTLRKANVLTMTQTDFDVQMVLFIS